MGTVRLVRYDQVAPGDVAFDRARSTYGRLVELTTREEIAHCFVYHRRLGTTPDGRTRWLVAEMSAKHGAVFTERIEEPLAVVRPWRVAAERDRLLEYSRSVVAESRAYDWPEIARIAVALASGRVIPRKGSERTICVAHVLRSILTARPDLARAPARAGRGRLAGAAAGRPDRPRRGAGGAHDRGVAGCCDHHRSRRPGRRRRGGLTGAGRPTRTCSHWMARVVCSMMRQAGHHDMWTQRGAAASGRWHMRTTVTLDEDVAAEIERLRRQEGLGLSEAVNRLVRAGMAAAKPSAAYRHQTRSLGLRMDVADVDAVLDLLDED